MRNYASKLGSDCPFFIENKPVLATGKGDVFEEIEINLSKYHIVIVKPDIHVNTAEAYSWMKPANRPHDLKSIISQPVESWKEQLRNDFEKPVFKNHPEIGEIKEKLYKMGAVFASMSGSGSAVYGLFRDSVDLEGVFGEWFVWSAPL
jgi:4-diphosphocytidyl-2-C-methyl-D-erythritol kinase